MPAVPWPVQISIDDSCAFLSGEKGWRNRESTPAKGLKSAPLRYRIGKEFLKQFKLSHCDSNIWGPVILERCQRFAVIALSVPGALWEAAGNGHVYWPGSKEKQWEIQNYDGS